MEKSKIIEIDKDSLVKYGQRELKGYNVLATMVANKKNNMYKFSYTVPELKQVTQDNRFIHSRVNGHKCIVGRFDRALVIDEKLIPYGDYVILDPSMEYLYPVSPSELNMMSNANVKIYDAIEVV